MLPVFKRLDNSEYGLSFLQTWCSFLTFLLKPEKNRVAEYIQMIDPIFSLILNDH